MSSTGSFRRPKKAPIRRPSANAVVKLYAGGGRPEVVLMRAGISLTVIYMTAVYCMSFILAVLPPTQALIVCMHWVKYFTFADYARPARLHLLNVRNVRINTSDGHQLGAWHGLPARRFATHHLLAARHGEDDVHDLYDAELASSEDPLVIFFHGNAETRATQQGPIHVRAITAYMGAHALSLDYRGFGDSRGWPTEYGMALDARAAWDWATRDHGVRPGRIVLWGHSLGASVAARLAADLAAEHIAPLGLVLESPFLSTLELLPTYPLGRMVCWLPGIWRLARWALAFRLDNLEALRALAPSTRVLLLHGARDRIVPVSHSDRLARDDGGADAEVLSARELVILPTAAHHDVLTKPKAVHAVSRLIQVSLVERHTPMGSWQARIASLLHTDTDGSSSAASRHELVDAWAPVLGGSVLGGSGAASYVDGDEAGLDQEGK